MRKGYVPIAMNTSKLPRLNFVELRSKLKLIPSLILPPSSFNSFHCSNIVKKIGTTNICSSFEHSLHGNYITKHERNVSPPTINLNIVNTSSSNFVTIFTSFSPTKGETIHDSDSSHNQFTFFSNNLPSSILTDPFINIITAPLKFY